MTILLFVYVSARLPLIAQTLALFRGQPETASLGRGTFLTFLYFVSICYYSRHPHRNIHVLSPVSWVRRSL